MSVGEKRYHRLKPGWLQKGFDPSLDSHGHLGHSKGAQQSSWSLMLPSSRDFQWAERPGSGSLSRPPGDLVKKISLGPSEI
ncbi:mCG141653 [Mus musculus]|nr:mCG141653 [Mus musculus]